MTQFNNTREKKNRTGNDIHATLENNVFQESPAKLNMISIRQVYYVIACNVGGGGDCGFEAQ